MTVDDIVVGAVIFGACIFALVMFVAAIMYINHNSHSQK